MRTQIDRTIAGVLFMLTIVVLLCWQPSSAATRLRAPLPGNDPAEEWQKASHPEQFGWSPRKLAEARDYAEKIGSAAVMIVDDGMVIDAWGDIERNFQCHSMRKSLLSALIGVYTASGAVDLSKSLAELNINDYGPSLTRAEKQATVGDLIKARSGIYHAALGESHAMKARRPKRHSHPPGTFWYYNNWDFNALGTIFEKETGENIFEAFEQRLARPLQMQDFRLGECQYKTNYDYGTPGLSIHRYYLFRMSARDLARLGLLFLRAGRWGGRQIIPAKWVRESTASHSQIGSNSGYGYMWWTGTQRDLFPNVRVKDHCYYAAGWGGHRLIVLPWRKLVIVHRVNTDQPHTSVANHQIGRLLWHLLDAAGQPDVGPKPTIEAARGVRLDAEKIRALVCGSTIQGADFKVRLTRDNRFELWSDGKRVDTGSWGIQSGKFWLKSRIVTGGYKAHLNLVLDGDRLQWYDRHGTLHGQGVVVKEVN